MSSPSLHLICTKSHTRCTSTSSKDRQGCIPSPLLSLHFYYAQSSFLAPHTFLFHPTLFSHRPSFLSTSHLSYYLFFYQSVLLYSLYVSNSKPFQHTLLCLNTQQSRNTSSFLHLFISHSVPTC